MRLLPTPNKSVYKFLWKPEHYPPLAAATNAV